MPVTFFVLKIIITLVNKTFWLMCPNLSFRVLRLPYLDDLWETQKKVYIYIYYF